MTTGKLLRIAKDAGIRLRVCPSLADYDGEALKPDHDLAIVSEHDLLRLVDRLDRLRAAWRSAAGGGR